MKPISIVDNRKPLSHTLSQYLSAQKLNKVTLPTIDSRRCVITRNSKGYNKQLIRSVLDSPTNIYKPRPALTKKPVPQHLHKSLSKAELVYNRVSTQAKVKYLDDMAMKLKMYSNFAATEENEIKKIKWKVVDDLQKDTFYRDKLKQLSKLKDEFQRQADSNDIDTKALKNGVKKCYKDLIELYDRYRLLKSKYDRLKRFQGECFK